MSNYNVQCDRYSSDGEVGYRFRPFRQYEEFIVDVQEGELYHCMVFTPRTYYTALFLISTETIKNNGLYYPEKVRWIVSEKRDIIIKVPRGVTKLYLTIEGDDTYVRYGRNIFWMRKIKAEV